MLTFLLDTNLCIEVMRSKPVALQHKFTAHAGRMAISAVTYMELAYGVEYSGNQAARRQMVEEFCATLPVLDYDREAAAHTGQIRAELTRSGNQIGPYDQMIAGHARSRGLVVVTNNTREFLRVAGLRVEDWTA
jgi:tRNA(fMet)-specific endonuclease VapC